MSIAAILRALAQGFENAAAVAESDPATESAAPAKAKKTAKAAAAPESALPATSQPPAAATAPATAQPAAQPASPTVTKDQVNKAVLYVAGKSRDAAIEILARFGATNTATLPAEKYQAVLDAFEEKRAQLDAASVQQAANGSLV
jgi:hypothetical protein